MSVGQQSWGCIDLKLNKNKSTNITTLNPRLGGGSAETGDGEGAEMSYGQWSLLFRITYNFILAITRSKGIHRRSIPFHIPKEEERKGTHSLRE